MKAVICPKYGPPEILKIAEVPKPKPGKKDVLIKIHAATVTLGDCELRSFTFPPFLRIMLRPVMGFFGPRKKILGQELAGEVEAVGEKVTKFKPGDRVFAATGFNFGAYAEYQKLPEKSPMAVIPDCFSFEEAATLPTGGLNALDFINRAEIKKDESVLIVGAGGSIGTYALQMAKHMGAKVFCVDRADKKEMLECQGADGFVDYQKEDFTKQEKSYDVIIDVIGKFNFEDCISVLNPGGRLILGNPLPKHIFKGRKVNRKTDKKVITALAGYKPDEIQQLLKLVEEGVLDPVIDKIMPLENMIEAHQYVEAGNKKGNLVIVV